ncbi:hypothetical protein [Boudabousia marimammalium]|uniref:Uncharacterized protein n=1 Tax=Boudabousia marimammalium TaxID=156892 RepID=A0A1Q5PTA1_9ACTO|nr:hypothetical protein [Boudabousia marimammalium]OKL50610.1 hypothetical protein BM477_01235 [Boudabousia marimammalium]
MKAKRQLREALQYMTRYLPVNKRYDQQKNSVILPQLSNPLVLGTIGLGATATTALYHMLRRRPNTQLAATFEAALLKSELVEKACVRIQESMAARRLHVQLQTETGVSDEQAIQLAKEVLELSWNAPKLGPLAVMVEVLTAQGTMITSKTLGFESEVAYPHEMYERFGAPASDPNWLP